ncbi:hypothetical protein ACFPK1_32510 [Actinomycetospora rhizophila]|uniref:Small secreted hydrophilic protein n=1 Tax=Actinomycetospora rhizophila TaxID=1416876 RepID=A0ABV9ZNP7_9PSEU
MTKDRVGAGLAVLAAIIGLVLVFQFPQSEPGGDDDDDGPETSEVAPAVPGQPAPGQPAPGQVQQPAPGGQAEQPAPQQQEQPGDTDGDDDDDDG